MIRIKTKQPKKRKIANNEREKHLARIASLKRARSGTKIGSWEYKHYSDKIAKAQYQYAQTFKKKKQAEKLKRKRITKRLKTEFKYKGMKVKSIGRTAKQKDGKYIYDGKIIPQGIGVPPVLKAKNLGGYFRQLKIAYNKRRKR